jgi:DNA-binding NarL/FixJ family response regulator
MRAGASGFLLKNVDPAELVRAVRVVASGEALLAPAITKRLLERFLRLPPPCTAVSARLAQLTEREVEVLTLVGRRLSNAEIAEGPFLSQTTVKTHLAHIYDKLALRDRVQVVVLAYEAGLTPGGAGPSAASTGRSGRSAKALLSPARTVRARA